MNRIGENSLNKWPEQRKLLAMAAQLIRNYREPDDSARCIVDTRDAMADVHVAPGKLWKG